MDLATEFVLPCPQVMSNITIIKPLQITISFDMVLCQFIEILVKIDIISISSKVLRKSNDNKIVAKSVTTFFFLVPFKRFYRLTNINHTKYMSQR